MSAAPVTAVEDHLGVYRLVQSLLMQAETQLLRITTETELYSPITEQHLEQVGSVLVGVRSRIHNLQTDLPEFLDQREARTRAEEEAAHA